MLSMFRPSRILGGGVGLTLAGVALGGGVASAASFGVGGGGLATAAVTVPRCSTAGTTVVETLGAGTITGVSISNLAAACQGGTLSVTVNAGGGTTGAGSGTVPNGGGGMTVTVSPAVAFVANAQIDLVIIGP